jgi:hypothetical protein
MERRASNVNRSWLSYPDAVMASAITEKTAEWDVHWAQKSAVSKN